MNVYQLTDNGQVITEGTMLDCFKHVAMELPAMTAKEFVDSGLVIKVREGV
jgi:hypothetical protein